MKFRTEKYISALVLGAFCMANSAHAFYYGGLSPENFNKMYYIATLGKVGILREAVNRGLNIDSVNPNGDTGLCIAVKKNNYIAYNTFRMAGANPRHPCTYKMYKEYSEFLESNKTVHAEKIVGNEESLYYNEKDYGWWPWALGAALVGGGAYALFHKKGGGHHHSSGGGDTPIPPSKGYGLAGYLENYTKLVSNENVANKLALNGYNSNSAKVVDKIKFIPNMLDNAEYLKAYAKVIKGKRYHNLAGGSISLGDAAIGLASYDNNSKVMNDGKINIEAKNGAIGLVASNGSNAINGSMNSTGNDDSDDGSIRFIFKGNQEGDAVIGMYGDTHSTITNYGKIIGTASQPAPTSSSTLSSIGTMASYVIDIPDVDIPWLGEGTDEGDVTADNSGTMIGMALFDFYTGSDLSKYKVTASNYGDIVLQAGNNNADNVSISLIGMGSYIDDKFLNGTHNPSFAEQMILENGGNISLSYQKTYNLSSEALKLGNGGLIGMRADASTGALNRGLINIDMQATTIASGDDVAAGMLSVHGAGLVNGMVGSPYDGTPGKNTGGTIRILNEATSGGVFYGMLAAKGSGTQTGLYKWKTPFLHNYGLVDMRASNSYAMASFAGGEIINDGVIDLGVENGQSYYTNNKGLYAAGKDITEEVSLINNGIINVNSEESAAIYNDYSGSVTQTNTGTIYLSNKATNSRAFGGNFSTATNVGDILYKVGNSDEYEFPSGKQDDIGFNVETEPVAAVVVSSGEDRTTKQYVVNDKTGVITLGGVRDKDVDYGGTFGTAVIEVAKQGSADNKGTINLVKYDEDIMQFNVAMWLDSTSTAEAYTNNYGTITVDAANSIGMRNDSENNASATNFGNIYVNGRFDYGMTATQTGANIFNGRYEETSGETKTIEVTGLGAIGMYIKNGNAYNYGTIKLSGDHTTAFQLDGETASVVVTGNIIHESGLEDVSYFWLTNGATKTFQSPLYKDVDEEGKEIYYTVPFDIKGYTLAKVTTDASGGTAYHSRSSAAYVSGSNSHLFVVKGNGSAAYNQGTVEVSNGAKAMTAEDGASAYNDFRFARMTVKDDDSIGIYGTDKGTKVGSTAGANMYVEAGTGIYADGLATIENGGNVDVSKGVGLYISDGNSTVYTNGTNSGNLNASGSEAVGAKVVYSAQFMNTGNIKASSDAKGVYNDSVSFSTNESEGVITVNDGGTGIYSEAGYKNVINKGEIVVSGANAYGIYGDATNNGKIEVSGGTGVNGYLENSGEVVINSGVGVLGSIKNTGTVDVYAGIGVEGSGTNAGKINVLGGDAGVKVNGNFTNAGDIAGNGVGVEVERGSFDNNSKIEMSTGTGIKVDSGATSTNYGSITIGSGKGFHIMGGGSGINRGTITINEDGWGAYVETNGSFINTGVINVNSDKGGHCSNLTDIGGTCNDAKKDSGGDTPETSAVTSPVYIEDGAVFVNAGALNMAGSALDFDAGGRYVLASGGSYQADSLSGEVTVASDVVMAGFEDTYTEENAFVGENNGIKVSSESYMFDANTTDNGDTTDVTLTRKSFEDVVEDKEYAEFLEANYHEHNNEKMYQALKSANTASTFNAQAESESGKRFYANIARENMAVLRGLNRQEQTRALEDGVDNVYISGNYFRTGKDGYGSLSDYEDDVYSISLGGGTRLNRNWSIGGAVTAAYADSSYDDIHSDRDNKVIMAFLPILYQNNRFKFLTEPSIGVGYGSYKRKTLNNSYDADTFDIYYGMYNHAEYSIDMKVAELVAEAELNLQGISSDDAKEKGGLKLKGDDTTSLETGIGLKLRKRIALAKERELMLALGTKYYHELLDPYKDLTVGTSAGQYHLKGYDEDKNRLRTAAEAMYKDGRFALSAEIAHNMEKEDNVEGGLGIRFAF